MIEKKLLHRGARRRHRGSQRIKKDYFDVRIFFTFVEANKACIANPDNKKERIAKGLRRIKSFF